MESLGKRNIGVSFEEGHALIRLWAPHAQKVSISILGKAELPLMAETYGYWQLATKLLQPGDRYLFVLDDQNQFPDPASLSQPAGVHKASEAIDTGHFTWTDQNWQNPLLDSYVLYELHTGCFTEKGKLEDIIAKLPYLKQLGITALELMPLAQFPGQYNWGYDGVYPFAVCKAYGGPAALQTLVNACHAEGLAVVLDVVYNHLGPEGNYLQEYGPYFTEKYKTPWGMALNMDDAGCDGVRHYLKENMLMWFRDFHIDGLRLDAVHAIKDYSPTHILAELRQHLQYLSGYTGKTHYLMAESDLNDSRLLRPLAEYGYGLHAQWLDDFHHSLRLAAGEDAIGYYADFNGLEHLAKSFEEAFVYDGRYSEHRQKTVGSKVPDNPGEQFIVYSQNHDQAGNRLLGERSSVLYSYELLKLMAATVILSPYLPMLFMGEEWGETNPFLYFADYSDPELADAIRKGRKEEFKSFGYKEEAPDPMSEETFQRSKLQWELLQEPSRAALHNYYRTLLHIRREYLPLHLFSRKQIKASYDKASGLLFWHRWSETKHIYAFLNFSASPQKIEFPSTSMEWHILLDSANPRWMGQSQHPTIVPSMSALVMEPQSILIGANHV